MALNLLSDRQPGSCVPRALSKQDSSVKNPPKSYMDEDAIKADLRALTEQTRRLRQELRGLLGPPDLRHSRLDPLSRWIRSSLSIAGAPSRLPVIRLSPWGPQR